VRPTCPAPRITIFIPARLEGMLLAALLGTAFGASPLPFQTTGFMIGPIREETGWSLSQISLGRHDLRHPRGACWRRLFGAHGGPLRRAAAWRSLSLTAFGIVFASFSLLPPSLPWFYALWTLVGLVGIGSTPITWSRAVNLWFFRNRGLALGIDAGRHERRGTDPADVSTVWLIHRVRLAHGLSVDRAAAARDRAAGRARVLPRAAARGAAAGAERSRRQAARVALQQALHDRRQPALLDAARRRSSCVAFAYGGALVHMPTMLKAQGFVGTQIGGDRQPVRRVDLRRPHHHGPAARSLLGTARDAADPEPAGARPACCSRATSSASRWRCAALLLGFSSGAETDLVAYLAGRYFGMANYGRIYGSLYMVFGIASALSPLAYGWVRDSTGSYDPILFVRQRCSCSVRCCCCARALSEHEELASARRAGYHCTQPVCHVSRISPPNTMRYQANTANEWLLTKRSRKRIAASALANATTLLTSSALAPRPATVVSRAPQSL
jgi:OFA family oxalate/formate antiporter-like MFS transporter